MFKRIDRSKWLIGLIAKSSDIFSRQRGLPIVIGLILVVLGLVFQIVNIISENDVVALLGVTFNGLGVLIALIGVLLVVPLGGR